MAQPLHSHAAAGLPTYEVHELTEGDPPIELGLRYRTTDYGAAVEYAFEYLNQRDPRREGEVSALEITKVTTDGKRESVWQYSHTRQATAGVDLVGRWGFDVTRRWHTPAWTPNTRLAARR
ncbi:MAG: hypothetical protein WD027_00685 [Gaiellales bacterium]